MVGAYITTRCNEEAYLETSALEAQDFRLIPRARTVRYGMNFESLAVQKFKEKTFEVKTAAGEVVFFLLGT